MAVGSLPNTGPRTMAAHVDLLNAEVSELYNRATWLLGSVAGTDTITASASSWLTAYADGQRFRFKPANDNTGVVTLNINTIGAKSVVTGAGAALVNGSLDADSLYIVTYYATGDHFRLEGGSSGSGTSTPDEIVIFTAASSSFLKADYPGARQFVVTAIGPGGAGASGPGGGGQAGGVAIKRFAPADIAASITVTINSTKAEFTHTTAVVGNAGTAASGNEDGGSGGGTATGGDENFTGPSGEDVPNFGHTLTRGGNGGTPLGTFRGRGGLGGRGVDPAEDATVDSRAGQNGWGYGGGGGGGGDGNSSTGASSTGAPGAVFVEVKY